MTEIAYDEAVHALMARLLGGEVRLATIEPDNDDAQIARAIHMCLGVDQ